MYFLGWCEQRYFNRHHTTWLPRQKSKWLLMAEVMHDHEWIITWKLSEERSGPRRPRTSWCPEDGLTQTNHTSLHIVTDEALQYLIHIYMNAIITVDEEHNRSLSTIPNKHIHYWGSVELMYTFALLIMTFIRLCAEKQKRKMHTMSKRSNKNKRLKKIDKKKDSKRWKRKAMEDGKAR